MMRADLLTDFPFTFTREAAQIQVSDLGFDVLSSVLCFYLIIFGFERRIVLIVG